MISFHMRATGWYKESSVTVSTVPQARELVMAKCTISFKLIINFQIYKNHFNVPRNNYFLNHP